MKIISIFPTGSDPIISKAKLFDLRQSLNNSASFRVPVDRHPLKKSGGSADGTCEKQGKGTPLAIKELSHKRQKDRALITNCDKFRNQVGAGGWGYRAGLWTNLGKCSVSPTKIAASSV